MLEKINTANEKFLKTDKEYFTQNNRDRTFQQKIHGLAGSTWDATHMTSFLNQSFYSNKRSSLYDENPERKSYSIRRKKSGDYFFKNLRYDQNKSHIGYTKINPLVTNSQVSKQRQKYLVDFFLRQTQKLNETKRDISPILRCKNDAKFNFQANKVKFKATDPLTCRFEKELPQKSGYKIERMKRQIVSRHSHGIVGIDSPQNKFSVLYEYSQEKKPQVRQNPMSRTSFELDRDWKSKGRITPVAEQFRFRQTQCVRKFRKQNPHGYNIVSNRVLQD